MDVLVVGADVFKIVQHRLFLSVVDVEASKISKMVTSFSRGSD